jgi:hypothetical protein
MQHFPPRKRVETLKLSPSAPEVVVTVPSLMDTSTPNECDRAPLYDIIMQSSNLYGWQKYSACSHKLPGSAVHHGLHQRLFCLFRTALQDASTISGLMKWLCMYHC